jgi:hypothetical protein
MPRRDMTRNCWVMGDGRNGRVATFDSPFLYLRVRITPDEASILDHEVRNPAVLKGAGDRVEKAIKKARADIFRGVFGWKMAGMWLAILLVYLGYPQVGLGYLICISCMVISEKTRKPGCGCGVRRRWLNKMFPAKTNAGEPAGA